MRTRWPKFRWTTNGIENYHVPCPKCASVQMRITHVRVGLEGRSVWVVMRCDGCGERSGMGIRQAQDYVENGGGPLVQLVTD